MIKRSAISAKNGMVATSEPQAADRGLEVLKKGGNAVDAAIAVAACLTVTEPTSNGIGGDNFAMVWMNGELHGMNASGFSPKALSLDALKERNIHEIPKFGCVPITVPGAVKGWVALHQRFGKLPFADVLRPAIDLATQGFKVQKTIAKYWKIAAKTYQKEMHPDDIKPWLDTFLIDGLPPFEDQVVRLLDHAKTLEDIANTQGASFYTGELANKIDSHLKKIGGFLTKEDLRLFDVEWVKPLKTIYRGYAIHELPPNGQGLVALLALNIFQELTIDLTDKVDYLHKSIESIKLAFSDGLEYISDPAFMKTGVSSLLSPSYAKNRASLIGEHALLPKEGRPEDYGTVYLATADSDGNMVSMIQSNYMGFGSGIVVPNTGIALHNRGHNFSLQPNHDNRLEPLKRPYHTIIPGFITKDKVALGPFGVMGGFMQPQGHFQVISHMLDNGLDPQAALDQPRYQWMDQINLTCEPNFPEEWRDGLIKKGHHMVVDPNIGSFGRGQIIIRDPIHRDYFGGTEKRCDGKIATY